MAFRFEFDPVNKILLSRFEGRLTDESAVEFYEAAWKYATTTDAKAGIVDFSSVTEFPVSSEILRQLARRKSDLPNAVERPRVIVAPQGRMPMVYFACFKSLESTHAHSCKLYAQ
jgi:hypothetical protein